MHASAGRRRGWWGGTGALVAAVGVLALTVGPVGAQGEPDPSTSVAPTTTAAPPTTVSPPTTVAPPTTAAPPTTEVPPTTAAPPPPPPTAPPITSGGGGVVRPTVPPTTTPTTAEASTTTTPGPTVLAPAPGATTVPGELPVPVAAEPSEPWLTPDTQLRLAVGGLGLLAVVMVGITVAYWRHTRPSANPLTGVPPSGGTGDQPGGDTEQDRDDQRQGSASASTTVTSVGPAGSGG